MTQILEQMIVIEAPTAVVWDTLTDKERMKVWMGDPDMHIEIEVDWGVGNPIRIRGIHHIAVENTGIVLEFVPPSRLAYTHMSSLSRLSSLPENHATVSFNLDAVDDATMLRLRVTRFPSESIFKHLQLYWRGTLPHLRQCAERMALGCPWRHENLHPGCQVFPSPSHRT